MPATRCGWRPGTYSGVQVYTPSSGISQTQVVIIDKDLTVQGGYSPADWNQPDPQANLTVIEAQGQGRVVTVIGTNGRQAATLAGLTLTGGDYTGLGNPDGVSTIYCNGSGQDCGGGLHVYLSAMHLLGCVVEDNVAGTEAGPRQGAPSP